MHGGCHPIVSSWGASHLCLRTEANHLVLSIVLGDCDLQASDMQLYNAVVVLLAVVQ